MQILDALSASDASELAVTVKRRRLLAEREKQERIQRERESKEQRLAEQVRLREQKEFATVEREYRVCLSQCILFL